MPRTARASVGGCCDHVINCGNARQDVFHKPEDFAAFARRVSEAGERLPMRRVGWRRMANHFHLVLWPHNDGDLNRWKQWLLTAPVQHFGKASFAALRSAARAGKRAPPKPWGWNRPCNPAGGPGRPIGQD